MLCDNMRQKGKNSEIYIKKGGKSHVTLAPHEIVKTKLFL